MLIVNGSVLPANANKDHELFPMVDEYQRSIKKLKADYPKGEITLMRIGYPQTNPTGLAEDVPPIYFPMQISDGNGVSWAYCKGRPVIHPNGLRELPKEDRSEALGDLILLDINKKEDYTFYMMFKSGILNNIYRVFDPDGDRLKELRLRNERREVEYAISKGMDESKLRNVAAAWGVEKAYEKDVLLVQADLETKVFALDDIKKKNPTNLQLKGITEFLTEIKADDYLMPKALVQKAIDYKKLVKDKQDQKYYLGDVEICYIPVNKRDDEVDFIAGYLRHPDNKEKWDQLLTEMIDEEFITSGDKYSVRWLAVQVGIPVNQQAEAIRKALLDKFVSK